MTGGTGIDHVEVLEPEEAFSLFGHELRVQILFALWNAQEYSLTFTELYDAVDADDKGKFNYHLSQLVDQFVAHVDDRYELQYAGHRVIDAVQSGVLHETVDVDPIPIDSACPACDTEAALTFEYENHIGTVRCRMCDEKALEYPYDPAGLAGRSPDEIVEAFDRRTRAVWKLALEGICPICSGPVATAFAESLTNTGFDLLDRYEEFFAADHPVVASVECRRCSYYSYFPIGVRLLSEPRVTSYLHERGVDVRDAWMWELKFIVDADQLDVCSTDPWRVAVTVSHAGDELTTYLDESFSIEVGE